MYYLFMHIPMHKIISVCMHLCRYVYMWIFVESIKDILKGSCKYVSLKDMIACFSIQMSGGSGFEAFFTAEAVLVVSVFSKKERNDIPVMDCPIVCNKWVSVDHLMF